MLARKESDLNAAQITASPSFMALHTTLHRCVGETGAAPPRHHRRHSNIDSHVAMLDAAQHHSCTAVCRFYEVYHDELSRMDLIYCGKPLSACLFLMRLNVPLSTYNVDSRCCSHCIGIFGLAVVHFVMKFWDGVEVCTHTRARARTHAQMFACARVRGYRTKS